MDTATMCSLRLVASECCGPTTQTLFTRIRLTFTPSALTRPSRLEALTRIGHHIQHLTFSMPHTEATFLPPLLNPMTGREVSFLYTPHTSAVSVIQRPKYGSPELGAVLTQQYPPLFHAATNVPAFINALSRMPNLRHLSISCPGQDPAQRYRRDVVDYALISLRIAIERSPLCRLEKLSLNHIHPSGLHYLRHTSGFGCSPSAGRRWRQIKKLNIAMDSWDFYGTSPGLDHLKILDDYIRSFSSNLEKVSFGWNGRKGPCPFTLFTDPLFAPPKVAAKLFAEVTSPMSPLPAEPPRKSMSFPKLRYLQVRNAIMAAEQVADFVSTHRHNVKEFDFDNVFLTNEGTWEEALAPLSETSSSEEWASQQSGSDTGSTSALSSVRSREELDRIIDIACEEAPIDPVDVVMPPVVANKLKKERVHRRRRKRKPNHLAGHLEISSPILGSRPEVIDTLDNTLEPTVFDPNVQGVQRDFRQEAAQRELADDPDKRVMMLKRAKEAVLRQLGKEFCKYGKKNPRDLLTNTCSNAWKSKGFIANESNSALVPLMFSRY
jgi:hypothetical protein